MRDWDRDGMESRCSMEEVQVVDCRLEGRQEWLRGLPMYHTVLDRVMVGSKRSIDALAQKDSGR